MVLRKKLTRLSAAIAGLAMTAPAHAGMDPFIGEVMVTANNYCPRNWAEANGQLLPIAQHQALFSLLGTTYGGDGRSTFALPDLRGRTPIHSAGTSLRAGTKGGNLPAAGAGAETPGATTTPTLAMRYCIALNGIYPSRS